MLIGVGHPCRPGEKKTQRPTLVSSLTQVMQQPRDHGLAAGVHCHLSEKWPRSYMLNFVDPRDAKIEVDNDKACETLAIGTQGFWQERPAWTWHDRPWSWFCQSEAQGHVRNPRWWFSITMASQIPKEKQRRAFKSATKKTLGCRLKKLPQENLGVLQVSSYIMRQHGKQGSMQQAREVRDWIHAVSPAQAPGIPSHEQNTSRANIDIRLCYPTWGRDNCLSTMDIFHYLGPL